MGIFSDKCPECGYKVRKAARFCSKCGKTAPGGWWKCPTCNKWVGNESEYCFNCKTALHPESRDMIAAGVWQKPGSVFAQRFEVGDIRRLVEKGLQVQAGTAAILLDGGKVKDVLAPGLHNLESLARKINHWGTPPPRTAILVDNGDVALPLRLEELRSAEEMPIEFYGEVAFHFHAKKTEYFLANLMKENREVRYEDISALLLPEMRYAVENLCVGSTAEDLIKDPDRRLRLEDELANILSGALDRFGLEMVRVASAEFTGKEFEELRRKAGDVEILRRQQEFDQRVRELLSTDKMHEFKSEHDLEEYVEQLAQEKDVATETRSHELDMVRQRFKQEFEREEVGHEITVDRLKAEYKDERAVRGAQVTAEARDASFEQEKKEAEWAVDMRRKKQEVDTDRLERMAQIYSKVSVEAMVALIEDPAQREDLKELQRLKMTEGRSEKEILAMAADRSPAAADALAKLAGVEREELDRLLAQTKAIHAEGAERAERLGSKALDAAIEAGKRPEQGPNTQVIK